MTSRNDKARKRVRKERKRQEQATKEKTAEKLRLNPLPPTPVNNSRLRQIFANMAFRSHEKGGTQPFKDHVLGPHVKASTPEELENRTSEFYVRAALGEPEN